MAYKRTSKAHTFEKEKFENLTLQDKQLLLEEMKRIEKCSDYMKPATQFALRYAVHLLEIDIIVGEL